jgi:single-stranded-DNA-specific exonuclease
MLEQLQWQVQPPCELPDWFVQAVHQAVPEGSGFAAQLLWQRGIQNPEQLTGFINPDLYQPASPFEFGAEMDCAVARLQQAWQQAERVAIWGDFDADGITATAVLWDGLGQFFPKHEQLSYYIPNRLTESHGLSIAGINTLADQGHSLIVTCDTGSTSLEEINHAQRLGIDLIITDHHTLPVDRPSVTAIINPRSLLAHHPLAHLSGVAVAYKLIEALYQTLPEVPVQPLEELLDLVAIGLIADLVQLTGDCRYLAQQGIQQLQRNQTQQPPRRPGIARLLELCRKSGDRPTDISFGLGPRINAISRIYGDARFCVELLTSADQDRCHQLAEATELANARRKSLQKEVVQQAVAKLADIDLSTTSVIVLSDPQWSLGVLGLVAGQIAQEYNRPTILLSTANPDLTSAEQEADGDQPANLTASAIARGSARSVNQIDLYQLVQAQAPLLRSFGGHPFAAGLSLPIENIPLFTAAINRQMREQQGAIAPASPTIQADLTVRVADLSQVLFRELKLLEPYGMGNPAPKLLIQNCWFGSTRHSSLKDRQGNKVGYIKTEFKLWDDSVDQGFSGIWWGHYKDELPQGRCDAIVELDFNTYQKYHVRLVAVRAHATPHPETIATVIDWIVDWRNLEEPTSKAEGVLQVTRCPSSWDELQAWFRQAVEKRAKLAIAYSAPHLQPPIQIWQSLVGIVKYLSRTQQTATWNQLYEKLGIGDRALRIGFSSLEQLGLPITTSSEGITVDQELKDIQVNEPQVVVKFLAAVQEEQFRYQYFSKVPLTTIQATAYHTIRLLLPEQASF